MAKRKPRDTSNDISRVAFLLTTLVVVLLFSISSSKPTEDVEPQEAVITDGGDDSVEEIVPVIVDHVEMESNGVGSVLFGVFLAVLASAMNTLGLNFQRMGQRMEGPQGQALNVAGVVLATSCGLVDMISFAYAPQALLAPLGAFGLVFNLLLAPALHDEQLTEVDTQATMRVFGGIATCLLFGNKESTTYSASQIMGLMLRPTFGLYVLAVGGAVYVLHGKTQALSASEVANDEQMLDRASFPMLAGTLGGCTTLCAKIMTELFNDGVAVPYVLPVIALLALFASNQIRVLNAGLGRYSSLFVQPVFAATFVVSNVVGGGVFFNEFASFTLVQWVFYTLGIGLVVSGVMLLASKSSQDAEEDPSGKRKSMRKSEKLKRAGSAVSYRSASGQSKRSSRSSTHSSRASMFTKPRDSLDVPTEDRASARLSRRQGNSSTMTL